MSKLRTEPAPGNPDDLYELLVEARRDLDAAQSASLDAKLVPGFDLFAAWFDLDARLRAAGVVLTGEGRFDDSSLGGKGPGAIARRALELGKKVHVFAGQIAITEKPAGLHLHAITPPGTDLASALRATEANLAAVVKKTFG